MTEVPVTLRFVAESVGGRIVAGYPDRVIGNVVIDSRTLARGDFFVALRGPRFDGQAFVADAFTRGAQGALVAEGFDLLQVPTADIGVVEVGDTTRALQGLAHAVRKAAGSRVVATTGSAGKTTTKEAIAALLSARLHVVKNQGNLNNHIGLPLSLLQLRYRPDVAVMELGMNHAGEISALVGIAEPDVRVWTNVGDAHAGFFPSIDAIGDAKAEILLSAKTTDVLVCNADDRRVMARVGGFPGRTVTFGINASADVRAGEVRDRGVEGMEARVTTRVGAFDLRTRLLGRGNLANLLAATAVAVDFGIPIGQIASTAAEVPPADRRGAVLRLARGVVLIDDSYNSSPSALRQALEVIAHTATPGRRVAVLGEMLELGAQSTVLHEESGRAAAAGVDLLVSIGGASARALAEASKAAGMPARAVTHFETSELAAAAVSGLLRASDVVLVKGSRGTRTDIVADRIVADFG